MEINHPEVGRELRANELQTRTVVIIGHDNNKTLVTAWVGMLAPDYVAFVLGRAGMTFLVQRGPDDSLHDDNGKTIHVWEYLGDL